MVAHAIPPSLRRLSQEDREGREEGRTKETGEEERKKGRMKEEKRKKEKGEGKRDRGREG